MTKYCKDCKYFKEGWHYFWCEHPSLGVRVDNGKPHANQCRDMRFSGAKCGEDAKLFEPKPSLKDMVWRILKLK